MEHGQSDTDRENESVEHGRIGTDQKNESAQIKNCLSVIKSTTNITWTGLGSSPGQSMVTGGD